MMKKLKFFVPAMIGLTVMVTGCAQEETKAKPKQETKQEEKKQEAQITKLQALNAMTLQITFAKPLSEEEVKLENLEAIKKNFVFDNGMTIVNVPRLKTGATSTYIIPVTIQKPGTTYTLSYKGGKKETFEASSEKIHVRQAKQVTNDTFEIESFLEDGVTDYANVIEAYKAGRGNQAFQLDENNKDKAGKQYQIISSLRDRKVTITTSAGGKIEASYVPFTQATDGRQAPKFRLPAGQVLQPGMSYTVTSDWADIQNPAFSAETIAPLTIQAVEAIDNKSIQVTLDKDPKTELFAGRKVELQAADGNKIEAQYRFTSRKGEIGIFDLQNGATLQPNVTYTVVPMNGWATANHITFAAK
ncbi:hypothetical protein BACCIP111899_00537 [Bacillus rhizoplanae]|uniref:SbsA Ig-like domain-containing protein n=2 Tax=Bacillaceae TaxID=186817 RepID=A0ABM8Y6N8_9BACI|nr:hypothetical protein BACCIP111899_00537 [Bacillus rhizoplanae]